MESVKKTTWHQGCPVPPDDLRRVSVSYWDFAGRPARGALVVNKELTAEVQAIFGELFDHGFLIEKMQPIEAFGGSDDRSMEANNTSAYNCRDVTGVKGTFSNHSWGRAIDINPLTNPYVKGRKVLPPAGSAYLDRTRAYPGGILRDSFTVKAFLKRGWTWGGSWPDRQDYQHFEKPPR
ncbi:MAG: family peptidase [Bryobacterales bacterium]|nr:family peptidase [Bryobacterales bacterium]